MNARIQLNYPQAIAGQFAGFLSPSITHENEVVSAVGLEEITYRLMIKAMMANRRSTALDFLPIFNKAKDLDRSSWLFLAGEPEGKKVLLENDYLKVVLIRWEPGSISSIHNHPQGGGLITVLEGSIEEMRYWNQENSDPYSRSTFNRQATTYIDDEMGFHSVGNPFQAPAVTLHAYMKNRRKR